MVLLSQFEYYLKTNIAHSGVKLCNSMSSDVGMYEKEHFTSKLSQKAEIDLNLHLYCIYNNFNRFQYFSIV